MSLALKTERCLYSRSLCYVWLRVEGQEGATGASGSHWTTLVPSPRKESRTLPGLWVIRREWREDLKEQKSTGLSSKIFSLEENVTFLIMASSWIFSGQKRDSWKIPNTQKSISYSFFSQMNELIIHHMPRTLGNGNAAYYKLYSYRAEVANWNTRALFNPQIGFVSLASILKIKFLHVKIRICHRIIYFLAYLEKWNGYRPTSSRLPPSGGAHTLQVSRHQLHSFKYLEFASPACNLPPQVLALQTHTVEGLSELHVPMKPPLYQRTKASELVRFAWCRGRMEWQPCLQRAHSITLSSESTPPWRESRSWTGWSGWRHVRWGSSASLWVT